MQDHSLSFYCFSQLTNLTSAPDDISTGIEYCQKISENFIRIRIRHGGTYC